MLVSLNAMLVGASVGAFVIPVPERFTSRGSAEPSDEIVSAPAREPVADGMKVTLITQLAPGATCTPQPFVCAKSPDAEMLKTCSVAPPVLLRMTACAALVVLSTWAPNTRVTGQTLATGSTPVPERATTTEGCAPGSLLEMTTNPLRKPTVVGVNVTAMLHAAPGSRIAAQPLV